MEDKTPKPLQVKDPGIAVASTNARNLPVKNVDISYIKDPVPHYGVADAVKDKRIEPFHGSDIVEGIPLPAPKYFLDNDQTDYATYSKVAYSALLNKAQDDHERGMKPAITEDYPKRKGTDGILYPDYQNINPNTHFVLFRGAPVYQGADQLKFLNHSVFSKEEFEEISKAASRFGQDPAIMIAQRLMENASARTVDRGRLSQGARTWDVEKYMMKQYGLEDNLQGYFLSAGKPYVYKKDDKGEITEDWRAVDQHISRFNEKYPKYYDELTSLKSEADRHAWFLKNVGIEKYNTGTDKQFGFNYAERARFAADQIRKTEAYRKYFGK